MLGRSVELLFIRQLDTMREVCVDLAVWFRTLVNSNG